MLSNRRYIGELRLRDVVQPNAIPALVSGELVGSQPLHLAGARPFCRLKAPLGLLLLHKRELVQQGAGKADKKVSARHKAEESYCLCCMCFMTVLAYNKK